MDKEQISMIMQRSKGTFERNQRIKELCKLGLSYVEIGKIYHISRQRIERIINK